jgi:polar amino acid transport system substrate-binding protein
MAIIAHEFRNPLTSIQTYIQLLNEKYTDNDLNEFYISIVSQAINKLDGLIDKLVAFSSMQDYNLNAEDINDFMSEAAGYISRNIPQTHRFFKRLVDKSFYINADRKQLVKAIYFLVMSIVERTPDGSFITMSVNII